MLDRSVVARAFAYAALVVVCACGGRQADVTDPNAPAPVVSPSGPAAPPGSMPVCAAGGVPFQDGAVIGPRADEYDYGVDVDVSCSGKSSGFLRAQAAAPVGYVTLFSTVPPDGFRAQKLRVAGFVKSDAVSGWAGLWARVLDDAGTTLAFQNMAARPIVGTTDWSRYELVVDVPAGASSIYIGLSLDGPGQVWVDGVVVDAP